MDRMLNKTKYPTAIEIQRLAKLGETAAFSFDASALRWYSEFDKDTVISAMDAMVGLLQRSDLASDIAALGCIFGFSRHRHSFDAVNLDWNMTLSEFEISRTLARLLNKGEPAAHARRIHAFLVALGVNNLPDDPETLTGVMAEADLSNSKSGRRGLLFKNVPLDGDATRKSVLVGMKLARGGY